MKVFISYSRANRRRASRLAEELRKLNVSVWFDEWEILVGKNLTDQIYDGIRSSQFLLVLLTRSSVQSRWVKEELDFAKTQEVESRGIMIIPLLFENCVIPPALVSKVYADFRNSFSRGFQQLSKHFCNNTVSTPNEEEIIKYDLEIPMRMPTMLSALLAKTLQFVGEKSKRKEILGEIKAMVENIESSTRYFDVKPEHCSWMLQFTGQLEAKISSSLEKLPDGLFAMWFEGSTLLGASFEYKLPLISRIAYEIGRGQIGQAFLDDSDKAEWQKSFKFRVEDLGFSQRFYTLVTEGSETERVVNALSFELSKFQDYSRLRKSQRRQAISRGLRQGFVLVDNAIWACADGIDLNAHVSSGLQKVAEFILSEFGTYEAASVIMGITKNILYDSFRKNRRELEILKMLEKLKVVAKGIEEESAKAFLLGYYIGNLQGDGHFLGISDMREVQSIMLQLDLSIPIRKRLEKVFENTFYGESNNLDEITTIIAEVEEFLYSAT